MSGRRPFTARGARTATEADHAELGRRGRSASTVRAYHSDLADFTRFHPGPLTSVTPAVLRAYLATLAGKTPTTRARREAALSSLLAWAYRAELIDADPMTRLDRTGIPASLPRPMPAGHAGAVLQAIPRHKDRDLLLFTLLYTTGRRDAHRRTQFGRRPRRLRRRVGNGRKDRCPVAGAHAQGLPAAASRSSG